MSSVYPRGNSLWIAYKDERGIRVCRPSGYKVGEEEAAQAVAVELDRKAKAEDGPRAAAAVVGVGDTASTLLDLPTALVEAAPVALPPLALSPSTGRLAMTVREWGEQWLKTRDEIESVAEIGRLRNHVFPALGHLKMREVRPRHIEEFIKALKKAHIHKRGLGKGYAREKMAPRTVRHIYGLLRRMFAGAVRAEIIELNPVTLPPDVLPKNVDKDPAWRPTALYQRHELVRIVSDPIIPPDRRIINGIKGLGGCRHGEAAGVRWNNYLREVLPLKKLVIARSYNKDGTKTKVPREVPVHPALDQLLEEWWESGWAAMYGRDPRLDDYIVPRSIDGAGADSDADDDEIEHDDLWPADQVNKLFHADLDALGIRRRRGHDLRRTFITLAREDGARGDVLEVVTHAPNPNDMMNLYTSFSWPTLCAEVAKLKISLPERQPARALPKRPETVDEHPPAPIRPTGHAAPRAARPVALAALLPEDPPSEQRPTESCRLQAPVRAETSGAPRSFGGVGVAAPAGCSATGRATCSTENPTITSRCPGLNRGPTVYETVALPLSYSGEVGANWYPSQVNRASGGGGEVRRQRGRRTGRSRSWRGRAVQQLPASRGGDGERSAAGVAGAAGGDGRDVGGERVAGPGGADDGDGVGACGGGALGALGAVDAADGDEDGAAVRWGEAAGGGGVASAASEISEGGFAERGGVRFGRRGPQRAELDQVGASGGGELGVDRAGVARGADDEAGSDGGGEGAGIGDGEAALGEVDGPRIGGEGDVEAIVDGDRRERLGGAHQGEQEAAVEVFLADLDDDAARGAAGDGALDRGGEGGGDGGGVPCDEQIGRDHAVPIGNGDDTYSIKGNRDGRVRTLRLDAPRWDWSPRQVGSPHLGQLLDQLCRW